MTIDEGSESLVRRAARYYASKTTNAVQSSDRGTGGVSAGDTGRTHVKQRANWQGSGFALKGLMSKLGGNLDLPFKSVIIFVGSWLMLETGLPLLIVVGVATAGSIWSISSAIPLVFLSVYCTLLSSGSNLIRSLVLELGNRRDNMVKALFRGYFWSILAVGLLYFVHGYFCNLTLLYNWPVLYFIPIDVSFLGIGGTAPVPVPLGIVGYYMNIIATVIMFAVGVTGSCIGGLEILRYVLDSSREHGLFGAIFGVLMLAVYPAMNVYFSSIFLHSILDLLGRLPIVW